MAFRKPRGKRRLKVLLFGTYGTGKTVAAIQAPGAAVFDLEEGTNFYESIADFRVDDEKDPIKIIDSIDTYAKNPVIKDPDDGSECKIKTIVIDPIHMWELGLEQQLIARRRKEERNPNYLIQPQDYKALKFEKKRLQSRLLSVDMNTIVCARTKDIYAPGEMMKKIGIGPDCDEQWMGYFDTIIYIYFDAVKGNRRTAIVYGKDRTNCLPKDDKGKYLPFEWSYENFAGYMKGMDFGTDSDVSLSEKSINELEGRHFETMFQGAPVKTAGVTGETLDILAAFYADPATKDQIKYKLATIAEVAEPFDLTEDMAKFLIDAMNQSLEQPKV